MLTTRKSEHFSEFIFIFSTYLSGFSFSLITLFPNTRVTRGSAARPIAVIATFDVWNEPGPVLVILEMIFDLQIILLFCCVLKKGAFAHIFNYLDTNMDGVFLI